MSGSDRELVHQVCVEFDKLLHPKRAKQKEKEVERVTKEILSVVKVEA